MLKRPNFQWNHSFLIVAICYSFLLRLGVCARGNEISFKHYHSSNAAMKVKPSTIPSAFQFPFRVLHKQSTVTDRNRQIWDVALLSKKSMLQPNQRCISFPSLRNNGNSNDNEGNFNGNDENKGIFQKSYSRKGGRSKSKIKRPTNNTKNDNNVIMSLINKSIPFVLLMLLFKGFLGFLFGGLGGSSNVVYYQSTVYERTYYNQDGEVERIRKENVRSNVPGIISDERLIQGNVIIIDEFDE